MRYVVGTIQRVGMLKTNLNKYKSRAAVVRSVRARLKAGAEAVSIERYISDAQWTETTVLADGRITENMYGVDAVRTWGDVFNYEAKP